MLKILSAALVLGTAMLSVADVAAQMAPIPPLPEPPPPAAPFGRPLNQNEIAFYNPALAQGRQLIGLGDKCLTVQQLSHQASVVMQPCAVNLVSQRFIVDGNKLRLGVPVLVEMPNRAPRPTNFPAHLSWPMPPTLKMRVQNCLTANDAGDLRIDVCAGPGINPAHQNWVPNVNGGNYTVNSGPFCLDVANSNRNNGARVIAYRCNWGQNQSFRLTAPMGAPVR